MPGYILLGAVWISLCPLGAGIQTERFIPLEKADPSKIPAQVVCVQMSNLLCAFRCTCAQSCVSFRLVGKKTWIRKKRIRILSTDKDMTTLFSTTDKDTSMLFSITDKATSTAFGTTDIDASTAFSTTDKDTSTAFSKTDKDTSTAFSTTDKDTSTAFSTTDKDMSTALSKTDKDTSTVLSTTERTTHITEEYLCPGLPNLQNGRWRVLRKKIDNKQVVASICNKHKQFSSRPREIPCDIARSRWRDIDRDCNSGYWTFLNDSPTSELTINLPCQLKYVKWIGLTVMFKHALTIFLHNSEMPLYRVQFTLSVRYVNVVLFRGEENIGKFSQKLMYDAPKLGKGFMLLLGNNGDKLKYRLLRGNRECHVTAPGFLDGVDRLTVDNHNGDVGKIRVLAK